MTGGVYSQNDEDVFIVKFFGESPSKRFLDIGAHDGQSFSNTRWLVEKGWRGTLVEPSPMAFVRLMERYRGTPEMNLVNVAIANEDGLTLFYDSLGDCLSTCSAGHQKLWASKGSAFQSIYVNTCTIAKLLAKFPGPYDFVNLDVEGANLDIFKSLPLAEMSTRLIAVEYYDPVDGKQVSVMGEMVHVAAAKGYEQVHVTGENILFARKGPRC